MRSLGQISVPLNKGAHQEAPKTNVARRAGATAGAPSGELSAGVRSKAEEVREAEDEGEEEKKCGGQEHGAG